MSSLTITGNIYIGVRDLNAALAWYEKKLDLHESREPLDQEIGDAALSSANGDVFIAFGAPNPANVETQILFVKSARKAREWLAQRGANVGDVQKDCQGTHYFEMRDMENNMIEFSEEP